MINTHELTKHGQHSFVAVIKDNVIIKYVICSYYDSSRRYGDQWCWGHYFFEFEDAIEYWNLILYRGMDAEDDSKIDQLVYAE